MSTLSSLAEQSGVLSASQAASFISPSDSLRTETACWYAIRTRSRHEKMVARQLHGQEIEAFLPLCNEVHRWSDRQKEVGLPLFPGYAFVRVIYSPEERVRVLRTFGVAGFVGTQGRGIPIPDRQIEDI